MRTFVGLCLGITLMSAPAFAQESLSDSARAQTSERVETGREAEDTALSFGYLDQLRVTRAPERPISAIAPFDTDQLALDWRPGSKWGITLDLTQRSSNDVLPREELSAGAYYQITPRFRFGGALSLNGDSIRSAAEGWREEEGEAGVRIESAFSF